MLEKSQNHNDALTLEIKNLKISLAREHEETLNTELNKLNLDLSEAHENALKALKIDCEKEQAQKLSDQALVIKSQVTTDMEKEFDLKMEKVKSEQQSAVEKLQNEIQQIKIDSEKQNERMTMRKS